MEEREKSKPVVSVIIPVYNLENYLDTCLDSVGRQTYGDFEAIVVDDGSTDGSQAVALRHAERDARIVVISTVNQGAARARETGIRHAQGDYICFLDGDDVWDSRMLEKLVAAIGENGGYDIVCCDYKRICKTYEAPRREMRTSDMQGLDFLVASLYHAISVTVWGRLYRRALFEKELRHYPLRLGEDSLLNIQIGCQQPRVRFIDYVGYGYVQRGGRPTVRRSISATALNSARRCVPSWCGTGISSATGWSSTCCSTKCAGTWSTCARATTRGPAVRSLPRDQCGGRTLPRGVGRVLQPLRLVAAADGQAAVDAPRVLSVSTLMRWGKSLKRRLTR